VNINPKEYLIVEDVRLGVWMVEMADLIKLHTDSPIDERELLKKLIELKEVLNYE